MRGLSVAHVHVTKALASSVNCNDRARVQPKRPFGSHTGVDTPRLPLSQHAVLILDSMTEDRVYGPEDLLQCLPDAGLERLRAVMHELWIDRQIERVGYSGWRRASSTPPHRPETVAGEPQFVKPEELFDHASFADFFK